MKTTGYIWLCDARHKIGRMVSNIKGNTPIKYSMECTENEQLYTLTGNGVIVTICVQILKPIHKGGIQ